MCVFVQYSDHSTKDHFFTHDRIITADVLDALHSCRINLILNLWWAIQAGDHICFISFSIAFTYPTTPI